MIDKVAFTKMLKELDAKDAGRDEILKLTRDVLTQSKKAIYSIHRDEITTAQKQLEAAQKTLKVITKKAEKIEMPQLLSAAAQEYTEAATYFEFVVKAKISTAQGLGVTTDDYLGGISDLSGELVRRALTKATNKEEQAVHAIHAFVDTLYGLVSTHDFRNGELRKKADQVRWNLRKIEEIRYDLSKR